MVSQQELFAPTPCPPNSRWRSSPPKLCPQRLAPKTIDPTRILNFIEPILPMYIGSLTATHIVFIKAELRPISAHEVAAEIALDWRGCGASA